MWLAKITGLDIVAIRQRRDIRHEHLEVSFRRSSNAALTDRRLMAERMVPAETSTSAESRIAERNNRPASERGSVGPGSVRRMESLCFRSRRARCLRNIAKAAHGLDHIDAELLAQPPDEDLDRVGIAIEILIIKMFHQFRA